MDSTKCPNCGKSLKGFLSSYPSEQHIVDFINRHSEDSKAGYCTSCAPKLTRKIATEFAQQKGDLQRKLSEIIHYLPVLTSQAPVNWGYEVIGMVNAQTTLGTGVLTELSRSWNDLFGDTSNASNKKIETATTTCTADLRLQCAKAGGNAVIATDIDFSEIGTGSGNSNMLMVCMAGTAIKVSVLDDFPDRNRRYISEISDIVEKLQAIAEMSNPVQ